MNPSAESPAKGGAEPRSHPEDRSPYRGSLLRPILRAVAVLVGVPLTLAIAALGLFAILGGAAGYPNDLPAAMPRPGFIAGAYHVHSTASDGRGTVEEIAGAARAMGLAFVILTDHNVAPRAAELVDEVLIIYASELSTPLGHVVALGLDSEVTGEERGASPLEAIARRGGAAVLAHPVQNRNPWRRWEPLPKVAGLELYSADTMLREAVQSPVSRLLPAAGGYLAHPSHGLISMVAEQPEATRRLLQLTGRRPPVALCAHDAHGLPQYADVFRVMAMYLPTPEGFVLPAEPEEAERWILQTLLSGAGLCVFRALGAPDGFTIEGLDVADRRVRPGSILRVIPPRGTPDAARLRIAGNVEQLSAWTVRATSPGALQIELWRQAPGRFFGAEWKPWIVPSPVRVDD